MKWSPWYQRQIEKAVAFDADQAGFVSGLNINPIFEKMAGDQAMQIIQQMQLSANQLARDRSYESASENLDLSKDKFKASTELRDKEARFNEKDSERAERLGLINLAGSTLLGGLDLKNKLKQTRKIDEMTKKIYGV